MLQEQDANSRVYSQPRMLTKHDAQHNRSRVNEISICVCWSWRISQPACSELLSDDMGSLQGYMVIDMHSWSSKNVDSVLNGGDEIDRGRLMATLYHHRGSKVPIKTSTTLREY
jgi:hypothetical protein